jgi:hypothetical protein
MVRMVTDRFSYKISAFCQRIVFPYDSHGKWLLFPYAVFFIRFLYWKHFAMWTLYPYSFRSLSHYMSIVFSKAISEYSAV